MRDPQSTWMTLGRELFKACESMRADGGCRAGAPTFHWLIKHSIFVQVSESNRRLWITRDALSEEVRFQLKYSHDEVTPPETLTIVPSGETTFRITGIETDFTTNELCNELLDILCRDR